MFNSIKNWLINFENSQTTGRQTLFSFLFALFVGVSVTAIIMALFGSHNIYMTKKQYEAKTAVIQKAYQTALADAKKHNELAQNSAAEAERLKVIIEDKANNRQAKDKSLEDKAIKTQEVANKLNEDTIQKHNADIKSINDMDDSQREQDICLRIKELATANPIFKDYLCSE